MHHPGSGSRLTIRPFDSHALVVRRNDVAALFDPPPQPGIVETLIEHLQRCAPRTSAEISVAASNLARWATAGLNHGLAGIGGVIPAPGVSPAPGGLLVVWSGGVAVVADHPPSTMIYDDGEISVASYDVGVDVSLWAGNRHAGAHSDLVQGSVHAPGMTIRIDGFSNAEARPGASPANDPVTEEIGLGAIDAQPTRTPLPQANDDVTSDPADPKAAIVRGLKCRNGHLNHPDGRLCSRCGDNLQNLSIAVGSDGELGELGVRPPLGILVFDDGQTFQVDSDIIIGRSPTDNDAATTLLRFEDDLRMSRHHLRIELDGWHVFLSDLNSSNGTTIRSPGAVDYVPLPPGERVPLRSGTVIVMGSRWVTYTATSAAPPQ